MRSLTVFSRSLTRVRLCSSSCVSLSTSDMTSSLTDLSLTTSAASSACCQKKGGGKSNFVLIRSKVKSWRKKIQCFEGEVHSRKRKCIPFFSTLPPSFFVVVSCALCWLLALQHRGVWRMGNVIFFSISNLALACLTMHFFFNPPYSILLQNMSPGKKCCHHLIITLKFVPSISPIIKCVKILVSEINICHIIFWNNIDFTLTWE